MKYSYALTGRHVADRPQKTSHKLGSYRLDGQFRLKKIYRDKTICRAVRSGRLGKHDFDTAAIAHIGNVREGIAGHSELLSKCLACSLDFLLNGKPLLAVPRIVGHCTVR